MRELRDIEQVFGIAPGDLLDDPGA